MSVGSRARPPSSAGAAAARRAAAGASILIALLAGLLVLSLLPSDPGAIRIARISLRWWYGGLAAPLVALVVAIWACAPAGTDGAVTTPVGDGIAAHAKALASAPTQAPANTRAKVPAKAQAKVSAKAQAEVPE
jgi:hypothetical protein